MLINLDLLRDFINVNKEKEYLKNLLASIGIEVAGIENHNRSEIFEVEITPNRPDWLSHYGIAREIYAKERDLEFKQIEIDTLDLKSSGNIDLEVENSKDCSRYTGALIKNITVKESSPEIKNIIESLGMRPVNNLVDISNIILMKYGHPTHIFDYDKLSGGKIRVRKGKAGEKLILLDGRGVDISVEDLVIADDNDPIALAGVMGGEFSGVTEKTKNIVIESAWFNPTLVRRTSKRYALKTDASYLFERGADIEATPIILGLIIDMIEKDLNSELKITDVFDYYPEPYKKQIVMMSRDFPTELSGIKIEPELYMNILKNLGFSVNEKDDMVEVGVPSFRVDIFGKEDLVEEIIRIFGYDKLKSVIPGTVNQEVFNTEHRDFLKSIRLFLEAKGYNEVINYSFHAEKDNLPFGEKSEFVEIKNPIGAEFSTMRNSLLPGLLKNCSLNFNNNIDTVALFEFGTVFKKNTNDILEREVLSVTAAGEYLSPNWRKKDAELYDFFIFKSLLFSLFEKLKLKILLKKSVKFNSFLDSKAEFEIFIGEKPVGYIGVVNSDLTTLYKIEKDVFTFELDLKSVEGLIKEERFDLWNRFPSSTRDLSFLIDSDITYGEIVAFIEKLKIQNLEDFELVDIYEGRGIPEGKKSLLMSFRYRSSEKTLTGEEVNLIHNGFVTSFKESMGILPR